MNINENPKEAESVSGTGFVCNRPANYLGTFFNMIVLNIYIVIWNLVSFDVESSESQFASVEILLDGRPLGGDGTISDRYRESVSKVSR